MSTMLILAGVVVGVHLIVFCPYCNKLHRHGHASTEKKPTSRVSHCTDGEFYGKMYLVRAFTKKELEEMCLEKKKVSS